MSLEIDEGRRKIKRAIEGHINRTVVAPAHYLVEHHFDIQDDVANLVIIDRILRSQIEKEGNERLDDYLASRVAEESIDQLFKIGRDNEHGKAFRVIFLAYVNQLIGSITVEILSASYLSANILSRSLLEVLVNVSADNNNSMSKKIESISFLRYDEKALLNSMWKELCSWVHSYNFWLKEMCPVLASTKGLHHPELAKKSMVFVAICVDYSLTLGIELLDVSKAEIQNEFEKYHVPIDRFMMISRRLNE